MFMIDKKKYTDYLISTQTNYTGSYLADHSSNLSHDSVSYFLKTKKFTPSQLWTMVSPHIENTIEGMLILDDSIQNKKYSRFIELVKRQYSGNEKGLVSGICVVNLVHSSGNDGDYFLSIIVFMTLLLIKRQKTTILKKCLSMQ